MDAIDIRLSSRSRPGTRRHGRATARLGAWSPRRLTHRAWAPQVGNLWLFLALLGAAGLTGRFYTVRV
jgi:hypothetical protein